MNTINGINQNMQPFNADKFVNDLLRNQVKIYLRAKAQTNPKIIIKENFLFEVSKNAISSYHKEIQKRNMLPRPDDIFNLYTEMVVAITERHIFYAYKSTENERLDFQNSNAYKEKIINETVSDMIINKYFGHVSYNMTTAYFPPVSKIMVINNLLYEQFKNMLESTTKDSKHKAISRVFLRIVEQVKACCLLLDKYLFADTIAIWRGLFESELTLVVLSYWDNTISDEYLEFIEYQLLENNILYKETIRAELEKKLEEKANQRKVKKSRNFVNYGWLMQTAEYYEKNCQLSLKDGLAVVADKYIKYTNYQLASNISHTPFFSRELNQEGLMQYVVEIIAYSLHTIVESMLYYAEEDKLEISQDVTDKIRKNLADLLEMCKVIAKNNE